MRRYETYKDSGVQWLGEIPEHWSTMRAKNLFKKEQRPVQEGDEIVTCFRDGEVTLRKNRRISGFTEATDYSHYQHICKGDLVIHQMDAFAGSSGVSDSDGMGTPVLSVCSAKTNKTNNFYYAHILRLMGWNGFILSLYRGIRERSSDFRFDTFAAQTLPLPPLSEQQAIVSYLDDKCGKIDEWLDKKQKEVEHLQELKQRVIVDAVTRSLNPDVKMKATNIPWLPEIPEHWEIKKIKSEYKFKTGFTPDTGNDDYYAISDGVDWVTIADIVKGRIASQTKKQISYNYINSHKCELSRKGSLLYSFKLSVGQVAILDRDCYTNEAIATFEDEEQDKLNFLYYSSLFIEYNANTNIYGAKILNQQRIMNALVPVPPLSEQKQIVSYITEKTTKIDTLVANINKEIENIKEYKQRLISDVVTGQIRV